MNHFPQYQGLDSMQFTLNSAKASLWLLLAAWLFGRRQTSLLYCAEVEDQRLQSIILRIGTSWFNGSQYLIWFEITDLARQLESKETRKS